MARRRILYAACLVFLGAWPLLSAVKQVRVIAERASIYIEPRRTSSRIEVVGKGTILNLLQDRKVKDVWYYISFNSPRYGTRISGFIQEAAVELVVESPSMLPKEEEKLPPKVEQEQARPAEIPPPPKVEEKKEVPAETQAVPQIVETVAATSLPENKRFRFPGREPIRQDEPWKVVEITPPEKVAAEVKPAPETPPAITEVYVLTRLPKNKNYKLPPKQSPPQEIPWKALEMAAVEKGKPPAELPELALLTVPPKSRVLNLPKKEKPRDDPAWRVSQPFNAATPEPIEKAKPAEPQPIKVPLVKPPTKGPGFISLGLGYGSSFGGAGGCLQLNTRSGLSLHAGVGLYPTSLVYSETDWVKNEMLWSVGLKYYLPLKSAYFSPFIDIQYGGLRVEAAQVVIGIWDYKYVLSQEQKSLWGPSFLAGGELRKGRFGISASLGISYATTSWEYAKTKVSFVFDAGLVFHF